MDYHFILKILEPIQNKIFQIMKDKLKIIQNFQYNDELSQKYKRENLDEDKISD